MSAMKKDRLHNFLIEEKLKVHLALLFYPGSKPFENVGVARLAGALCFYLTKAHAFLDGNKRTATLSAVLFMNSNGWDLIYPENDKDEFTEFANIINQAAAIEITKDQLIDWFENHKIILEE
jgi:prophage maintenance system killer protein